MLQHVIYVTSSIQAVNDLMLLYSCRHIFVANSHNVFKLTPLPYEVQVQQLVQQQQYELAMQICVSIIVCMCPCVCVSICMHVNEG